MIFFFFQKNGRNKEQITFILTLNIQIAKLWVAQVQSQQYYWFGLLKYTPRHAEREPVCAYPNTESPKIKTKQFIS